jgi:hypothetical protein
MTNWIYKFDVNKFVATFDPDTMTVKEVVDKVLAGLRSKPPFLWGKGKRLLDELEVVENTDEFDEAWAHIYTFADENGAWLGI